MGYSTRLTINRVFAALSAAMFLFGSASASVVISTAPTKNMSCAKMVVRWASMMAR